MKGKLGRMRHRITIRQTIRVDDGGGGSERQDTNIATVSCSVRTTSVREIAAYGQLQERATHSIRLRWRTDVDQGQTVYWHGPGDQEPVAGSATPVAGLPLYVLSAVDDDTEHPREFLRMMCREGGET